MSVSARRTLVHLVPTMLIALASAAQLSFARAAAGADAPAASLASPEATGDDSVALSLAGADPAAAAAPGPLSLTAEAAATEAAQQSGGTASEQRLSFDLRYDNVLAGTVRAVFADRLDVDWTADPQRTQPINTLKQAYLSWQPRADLLFDAGRINARQGVALGYNPTDFFRAGALRAIESLDPDSLRDNRQGSVMLRSEVLWDSGALTALYSPRLTDAPSSAPFSPDWGATNTEGRWLLAASQRLAPGVNPQWLLFGADGASPQLGLNLTTVAGSAAVLYGEAAAGHAASLWTQALEAPASTLETSAPGAQTAQSAVPADPAVEPPSLPVPRSLRVQASLQARAATGITYSAANKLSVSLEYEYDGGGLSRADWSRARTGSPLAYARYREFVELQQELPTQHNLFGYAAWQDVMVQHLDLAAFVRVDLIDHSRLPWAELRYHWPHVDAAVRWQDYQGGLTSDFGATASRQTWQLVVDYYR
jgi:hypothetical protein